MKKNKIRIYKKAAAGFLLLAVLLTGCRRKAEADFTLREQPAAETLKTTQDTAMQHTAMQDAEADTTAEDTQSGPQNAACNEVEQTFCYVHICGEVKEPGVYKLETGSRVYEAAALAGGFTDFAAQSYVNQARVVEDGMKIVIPSIQEVQAGWDMADEDAGIDTETKAAQQTETLININTAGIEQLCTLPGIGESRAGSIIAYREAHGSFKTTEEIMCVEGIKEGAYSKIRDKISIK